MEKENNIVSIGEEIGSYDVENIKKLIYMIREKQVMLDRDVARLYQCETKYVNRVVKRNIERFPEEFCFQITEEEFHSLRWCQFVTASQVGNSKFRNNKYLPYAFTEQGIVMLSALLKSEIAVRVSINIMKAFIEMRKFIATNISVFNLSTRIENKFLEYDKKFDLVFDELQSKKEEKFKEKIFFEGQIYDAYSLIIKIIKSAKSKIVIIDNYVDDSILEMLSKKNRNTEVVVLTSSYCNITKLDVNKFNKQYPTLKILRTNKFHDRFILIDNKELYHSGASLKDLGKKCFAINKLESINFIKDIECIL